MQKKVKYSEEEWIQKLENSLEDNYQIALHQIGVFGTDESRKEVKKNNFLKHILPIRPKDFCKSIMNSGLKNRWKRLRYTVMSFGSAKEIADNKDLRKEAFLNYDYTIEFGQDIDKSKELYDVIIAIPSTAEIEGEKYRLGLS